MRLGHRIDGWRLACQLANAVRTRAFTDSQSRTLRWPITVNSERWVVSTYARKQDSARILAWATLGVDGMGIANEPPEATFVGMPRLTVRMVARLQGFPDDWEFAGKKTASYRQVGNAFPPPFVRAVAESIRACLSVRRLIQVTG